MAAAALASEFLSRNSEREHLHALLADVRAGHSAALVLRGEAGVGKTALLRFAARQGFGFRTAQIAGVEAEMELAFAGIHQLCAPMLDRLDALPAPQREALRVALGVATGNPPDRFLISLATLSLLSAVAEERPLLCLVDDAQWLDDASAQILAFVARRLLAESIAMVFAVREPAAARHFEGLPQLRMQGLDEGAAHALLSRAIPGPDRCSRPRPDRRRGSRQSPRAAGAATRDERRRLYVQARRRRGRHAHREPRAQGGLSIEIHFPLIPFAMPR
jgi:hypothetical protein